MVGGRGRKDPNLKNMADDDLIMMVFPEFLSLHRFQFFPSHFVLNIFLIFAIVRDF